MSLVIPTIAENDGNTSFEVPDFGTGDFEQIKEAITLTREGKINIYKYWNVGWRTQSDLSAFGIF